MVSLRYFLLCNLASMDQRDRLSCQGIFDSWEVVKLPEVLDTFYIAIGIDGLKNGEKASLYLSLRNPNGIYIWKKQRLNVESKNDYSPIVYVLEIIKFPVNEIGIYNFEIYHKNKIIGSYPLKINRLEDGEKE